MLAFYLTLIDNAEEQVIFEELYNKYYKLMVAAANRVLHDQDYAEDAVHEAFIGIAQNMSSIARIKNEQDLKNYMYIAAKNSAIKMIRKPVWSREESVGADNEINDLGVESLLADIILKRNYEDLLEAIHHLDDRYRYSLYFHFVLGFSIPETGKILGRSPNTIKKWTSRGKQLLLQILEEEN